jgi:hypothetical protein
MTASRSITAEVDPSKAPAKDASGRTVDADKLLKPFNLR